MEPRNFCDVQSPARVKLGMGVRCCGRNLLRPGIAAYTDLCRGSSPQSQPKAKGRAEVQQQALMKKQAPV